MADETVESLREKLGQYFEQLQTVEDVLKEDPRNEEYMQIKKDLDEVITLTKDLLKLKTEEKRASSSSSSASSPKPSSPAIAPNLSFSSSPSFFAVGTICEAKYSADNSWYKARIDDILEGGKYNVTYVDYGNREVVSIADIRPLRDVTKQNKNAPLKRPNVPDAIKEIPKSLQILPTDTEEERAAKKKRVHAIKSGNRLKTLEEERNHVKSNWLKFQAKPKRNVPMTLTSKKKGSIFASPDSITGKVGVTNSGKAMTVLTGVVEAKDVIKIAATKKNVFMPTSEDESA
jgi:survival-of-motor-neuron-related-splicing factor 30